MDGIADAIEPLASKARRTPRHCRGHNCRRVSLAVAGREFPNGANQAEGILALHDGPRLDTAGGLDRLRLSLAGLSRHQNFRTLPLPFRALPRDLGLEMLVLVLLGKGRIPGQTKNLLVG